MTTSTSTTRSAGTIGARHRHGRRRRLDQRRAAVAHGQGSRSSSSRGTLNHLARDLGLDGPDDAIAAVRDGHLAAVDLGCIDGKPFLNTASFGSYSEFVDARERLEGTLGKWPAMLVALFTVLRRATPLRVELDGHERPSG